MGLGRTQLSTVSLRIATQQWLSMKSTNKSSSHLHTTYMTLKLTISYISKKWHKINKHKLLMTQYPYLRMLLRTYPNLIKWLLSRLKRSMKMMDSFFLSAKTVIMASLPFTKENVSGFLSYLAVKITNSIRHSNLFQSKMQNKIRQLMPSLLSAQQSWNSHFYPSIL